MQIYKKYILILFILTCIFFGDFFVKGYLLEGTGDRIHSMVPLEIYASRCLKAGQLPEWNPHLYCGVTYIGTGYHNFFYPVKLLIYLLPEKLFPHLTTISAMVHLFFACFFFMLFARSLIDDDFWAFLGAIAYGFSFTLTYNLNYGSDCHIGLVFLPLILYLINTYKNRSVRRNFIFLTVAFVLTVLSGNIQLVFYIIGLSFLYGLYKSYDGVSKKFEPRFILILIAANITAAGITAVRILPFLASSGEFSGAFNATFDDLAKFDVTRPIALVRLFAPFFISGDDGFFMGGLGPPVSFNIYLGLIAAFLSVYALFFIWNRETVFWKTVFIVIVLIILGTPLAKLQYLLMGKTYLSYSRYAWLLPVPLSVLFVYAGSSISGGRKNLIRCIWFSAAVFIIMAAVLFHIKYSTTVFVMKLDQAGSPVYMAHKDTVHSLLRNMRFSYMYFIWGSVYFFAMLYSLLRYGINAKLNRVFLTAFLAIDLLTLSRANISALWDFMSPKPLADISDVEKKVTDEFVKSGKAFRVFSSTPNTELDGIARVGLYKPTGWGVTLPKNLAVLYGFDNINRISTMDKFPENERIRLLTSVALSIYADKPPSFYPAYLPRARLFTDYTVLPDDHEARNKLLSADFDIFSALVLSRAPTGIQPERSTQPGTASIIKDKNNTIEIKVSAAKDAILLITDNYAKGWRAFIDGKPAEIIKADIAFKAVPVSAGSHKVELLYRQPGLRIGIFISLVFTAIFLMTSLLNLPKKF